MERIDPSIATLLDRLSENLQVEYQRRIDQMEFASEFPARLTECIGLVDILRRNLLGLTAVTGLQIELDGQTQFLAVTDIDYARRHLSDIQAELVAVHNLREMVDEQYGGVAMLITLG